jgi:hypothetical protein
VEAETTRRQTQAIRTRLGLSQNGMVDALGLKGKVNRDVISTFERRDARAAFAYPASLCESGQGLSRDADRRQAQAAG